MKKSLQSVETHAYELEQLFCMQVPHVALDVPGPLLEHDGPVNGKLPPLGVLLVLLLLHARTVTSEIAATAENQAVFVIEYLPVRGYADEITRVVSRRAVSRRRRRPRGRVR